MALTFTTGLTSIDTADSTTNWAPYKLTAGGATPSVASVTDLKIEGTACNGIKPTSSKDCGLVFDYYAANGNTTLNMETAGNEVLAMWVRQLFSGQVLSLANGGLYIIVCAGNGVPGITTNWAKWYIGGSDANPDGWTWYQVDTRKTPSETGAGWTAGPTGSLSTVYRIGIGAFASAATAARVENLLVDEMWYGHPWYKVTGDGTTVADWADFLSDATTNVTGLIQDINGALEVTCGIQIGDDAQSSTTTFDDDTNQTVNWKRFTYHNGTSVVDALTYTDYYYLQVQGSSGSNTSFTLGNIVGTDAGIVGGTLRSLDPTNVPVDIDFSTDSAHISAMNLYGATFAGITGSILLGNDSSYDVFSCQWQGCAQVDPVGACVIRNNLFINTADVDAALLWQSNIDIKASQFIANTLGAAIEMNETTNQDYDNLLFSGNTNDTLLANGTPGTNINISKSNGSNPTTYENASGNTATITYVGAAVTFKARAITTAGAVIEGARLHLETSETVASGLPYQNTVTITNSGTTATVSHTTHGMASGDKVVIRGASHNQNNGVHTITVTGASAYTYTLASAPGSDPTGTITSTFVFLNGVTNASGEVSASRVLPATQGAVGRIRKGSAADNPKYKNTVLTGDVSNTINTTFTGVMIED